MTIIPDLNNVSNRTTDEWVHGNTAGRIFFGILVGCTLLVTTILLILCIFKKLQGAEDPAVTDLVNQKSFLAWTFQQIEDATNNFSIDSLLGQGRCGTVYEAIFPGEQVLAVRRIDPSLVLRHTPGHFSAAIRSLSRAQHRNIVPFLGFCEAPGERILVMEFMPGKTLRYHLHEGGIAFDWCHRLRIATEAAQGIEYLHEGADPCIIHGDIKPSNILLDWNLSARVSDFGLSFLASQSENFGTISYLDPQCNQAKLDEFKANDIYNFGVVLLEILSGRPLCSGGVSIVNWVVSLITHSMAHEIFDPKLQLPSNPDPLIRAAELASQCLNKVSKNRPKIAEVVAMLKKIGCEINDSSLTAPRSPNTIPLPVHPNTSVTVQS